MFGRLGDGAVQRLAADAALLSDLLGTEADLQSATADLVETQDQLVALYELVQSGRQHLEIDAALKAIVAEACRLLGAESAFGALVVADRVHIEQFPFASMRSADIVELVKHSQRFKTATLVSPDAVPVAIPSSVLLAPVRIDGAASAALGLFRGQGRLYASPEIKLCRALAEQAGAQIENVLLHQQAVERARVNAEMDLARQVQARLMPAAAPRIAGLDVHGRCRPALQVGGDFFDFVMEPMRPFTFVVGDVAGKGMPAALLMAMTRTAVRGAARFGFDATPSSIIRRASADLYDDFTDVGLFATLFVGQYSPDGRVRYANAGHSPVIHCSKDGATSLLAADAPPVGVLLETAVSDRSIMLKPGDALVVATDGFTDTHGGGNELFGVDRLMQVVSQHVNDSAADLVSTLYDTLDEFESDQPPADDKTVIVVKAQA